MFLINVLSFVKGCVNIQVEGDFLERFINICTRREIILWNLNKINESKMLVKINIKDFKKLRVIAFKTRCRVRVFKRHGLPFLLEKYKKRKYVLVGFFLFTMVLWYLTSHVTGIIITGNENISKHEIIRELKNFGLSKGKSIKKINQFEIENKIMTKRDDVAWVGINIKGSKLYVEIKERSEIIPKIDEDVPCHMIATKDGVIESLEVKSGKPVVDVGSAVCSGDLLVSGITTNVDSSVRLVHSFGEVYAKTWYKKSAYFPLEYEEKIKTGKLVKKISLEISNFKINFCFNKKLPFTFYEKDRETKQIVFLKNFYPHIYIVKDTFFEQENILKNRSEDETVQVAVDSLKKEIKKEIPKNSRINGINISHENMGANISVTVEYECIENIAILTVIEK